MTKFERVPQEIDALNNACHELREAFLKAHLNAPRTAKEKEIIALRQWYFSAKTNKIPKSRSHCR